MYKILQAYLLDVVEMIDFVFSITNKLLEDPPVADENMVRVYLSCPFEDKDVCKALGGRKKFDLNSSIYF